MNCKYIANSRGVRSGGVGRGFSLVEMLVVVMIMVIILGLVGRSFTTVGTRTVTAAERLASSIGLAGSHATARNRLVWVKINNKSDGSGSTELRFYQSNDGTNASGSVVEFRRPVVLEMTQVREDLAAFANRPQVPTEDRLKAGGALIITPAGEVYMANDVGANYPMPSGSLKMITEIGLQGVHGRTGRLIESDLAAVQVRGISGNPISYIP